MLATRSQFGRNAVSMLLRPIPQCGKDLQHVCTANARQTKRAISGLKTQWARTSDRNRARDSSYKLDSLEDASANQYAVKVGDLQWVRIPPGQSVARPEATRATKDRTASIKTRQRVTLRQQPSTP